LDTTILVKIKKSFNNKKVRQATKGFAKAGLDNQTSAKRYYQQQFQPTNIYQHLFLTSAVNH
jgi:hypothetical protein